MENVNGKDRCILCGVEVDIPAGKQPKTMIAGASGKPNIRIVTVDGIEIHRCGGRPKRKHNHP